MLRSMTFLLLTLSIIAPGWSQKAEHAGTIKGVVLDRETQAPLAGANILVMQSSLGAVSNLDGEFLIQRVPVGSYILQCRFIGYEKQTVPDIIVRPQRTTSVRMELKISAIAAGDVTVKAGYFAEEEEHPLSLASFSFEEIRRAPGAAGDISRIIQGLPSLAKVNDQANPLIVRGGSPMENAFYIDQIEVPNINHFPTQGASSGPIGMVQVDFIQDARFHAGGFSAAWGDRLSSILDITFREGSRERVEGQLDLNFAGFGGALEGPLPRGKGAWMFAVRRSYLDLVINAFDVGSTVAPHYGDYQGKIVWDAHPQHRISLLALWGDDHNNPDLEAARTNKMLYYGNQDLYQKTTGMQWRALWGSAGYSKTALSYSSGDYAEDFSDTNSGLRLMRNRSQEGTLSLRNLNHFRLGSRHSLEFGLELRALKNEYDNRYEAHTGTLGGSVPALAMKKSLSGEKTGIFVQYIAKPAARLTATLGLRGDYFSTTGQRSFSPRLSLAWEANALTKFSAAYGVFHQALPALLLAQQPDSSALASRERSISSWARKGCFQPIQNCPSKFIRRTIAVFQSPRVNLRSFPSMSWSTAMAFICRTGAWTTAARPGAAASRSSCRKNWQERSTDWPAQRGFARAIAAGT